METKYKVLLDLSQEDRSLIDLALFYYMGRLRERIEIEKQVGNEPDLWDTVSLKRSEIIQEMLTSRFTKSFSMQLRKGSGND